MTGREVDQGSGRGTGDRLWPILLTLGLVVVVVVNALFIYVAFSGADDVDPAYVEGNR